MASYNAERGGDLVSTHANNYLPAAERNGDFMKLEGAMTANITYSKHGKKINQETKQSWMHSGNNQRYPTRKIGSNSWKAQGTQSPDGADQHSTKENYTSRHSQF